MVHKWITIVVLVLIVMLSVGWVEFPNDVLICFFDNLEFDCYSYLCVVSLDIWGNVFMVEEYETLD